MVSAMCVWIMSRPVSIMLPLPWPRRALDDENQRTTEHGPLGLTLHRQGARSKARKNLWLIPSEPEASMENENERSLAPGRRAVMPDRSIKRRQVRPSPVAAILHTTLPAQTADHRRLPSVSLRPIPALVAKTQCAPLLARGSLSGVRAAHRDRRWRLPRRFSPLG